MAVMGVQMAEVSIFVTPSWMSRALPGLTRVVILRPDSSERVLVSLIANDSQAKIRDRMRSRLISADGKDF
ncbi:hypothetical protein [Mitsuokella multacida]